MPRSTLRVTLIALLALAVASPLLAYTIYLKDGAKIIAREKYRIEDDKIYFTLQSGTETYYSLAEIDIERTNAANQRDVGTALVVEGGKVREVAIEDVQRRGREERPTLQDLIASGAAGPSHVPEPSATGASHRNTEQEEALPRTSAGFVDLAAFDKKPLANTALASQIVEIFQRRELEDIEVYQGTGAGRPLVEVVTGSEAGVFRSLVVATMALARLQETNPDRIEALELLLTTPTGNRAGQFVLTADNTRELLSDKLDPQTLQAFFLQHVQF